MTCAPSEDLVQPGHLPNLIRLFTVCMKTLRCLHEEALGPWLSLERTTNTIRLGGWQADLSVLLGAQVILWFCHAQAF